MATQTIDIATAGSRKEIKWTNRKVTWAAMVKRLSRPVRTEETQAEYATMPKAERDEIKDVGGFVGGYLKDGRRKSGSVAWRSIVTLDMDELTPADDPWETVELIYGCAAALYSTHSHTAAHPRLRLVIPLDRNVTGDEYAAIARRIAADIGIDLCDDTTYEQHRLMYWPSCSADGEYIFRSQEGPWMSADEQLARYTDWRDPSEWPVSSRKMQTLERKAKLAGEPTEKPGLIGAFCRAYTVEDAIDRYLPEIYVKAGRGRYTYTKGTTTGGLIVYDNGKFAYSHHGTDPAGGRLCNAWDLVRIHLFGGSDKDAPEWEPIEKLPSSEAMRELVCQDKDVAAELFSDEGDPPEEEGEEDWRRRLKVNKRGTAAGTIDNILLILNNDPKLAGRFGYDEFHEKPWVLADLPWIKLEERSGAVWNDVDDAGLRNYLEAGYGIDAPRKTLEALELALTEHQFHPVREYLEGLCWDGTPRLDRFFIDTLAAEDTEYTRAVTRKALIGAVARIMEPGCKHDHMLVLIGPQGCGKSTTLMKLGRGWFSDSLFTMTGKDAYEQLQGAWIIEMSEMAAARKAEIEQIKQFVSKQTDSFRAAYARRASEHKRQCAFFGTTNDDIFLKDVTGGRRFWPVKVEALADPEPDIDQVWAEAAAAYKAGEKWYLAAKEEKLAREQQDIYTEHDERQGVVETMLSLPITADWESLPLYDRQAYYAGGSFAAGSTERVEISAIAVWCEFLNGDPQHYGKKEAREMNAILKRIKGWRAVGLTAHDPLYGRQRGYRKNDL